jgi:putative redox protein
MAQGLEINARTQGGMRVEASDGRHVVVMDEPVEQGGTDTGTTPMRLLLASLAGCTAITLKLYSARKGWPLEDVNVRVRMDVSGSEGGRQFVQEVELIGPLDAEQRERLHQIAGRCPVHRALEGDNRFEERLVGAGSAEPEA